MLPIPNNEDVEDINPGLKKIHILSIIKKFSFYLYFQLYCLFYLLIIKGFHCNVMYILHSL